jgi:hypothetical protein
MKERVLTVRELNRATLARQLLLERKRLSPRAVIEPLPRGVPCDLRDEATRLEKFLDA